MYAIRCFDFPKLDSSRCLFLFIQVFVFIVQARYLLALFRQPIASLEHDGAAFTAYSWQNSSSWISFIKQLICLVVFFAADSGIKSCHRFLLSYYGRALSSIEPSWLHSKVDCRLHAWVWPSPGGTVVLFMVNISCVHF